MALQLHYVTHSEIGLVRKNNQDSGYASPHLLVVADGMGGAAAGDLASAVAVDTIKRIDSPTTGEEMLEVLAGAIHRANDRIADLVEADTNLDGMGTTVTGAMFDGAELGLAHIGDSRAYLLRDGRLERLTHDHSWVQSLVDEGKISVDEAALHPHRSLLLKVLNGQAANDPDLTVVALRAGDRLMLCSDGLCGLVDDPVIAEALTLPDLDHALGMLVSEALAEGGIDNITVIVADVAETGGADAPVVLGAAAERAIPSVDSLVRTGAVDEDTVVTIPPPPSTPAADEPEDDEARYSPQPPSRRRWLRPVVGILVVLLVAGAGLGAAYAWTRTQYYVGAEAGQVAIFQGVSESVPGVRMAEVFEVQQLTVAELPPFYQDKVRSSIGVSSLESARQTVAELAQAAKRCANQQPISTPRPSAGPTVKPTGKPGPSVAPTTAPTASEPSC